MNEDRKRAVGRRLQEIRGSRDQRTFAEAVDSVQQTISKYERGEVPRSWLFLARLAEEEGVDLNALLTGESLERGRRVGAGSEGEPMGGNGNGGSRDFEDAGERETERRYAGT